MSEAQKEYRTIDARVASAIKDAHRKHSNLGSKGLLNVLKQSGYKVDPKELDEFMDENKMKPGSSGQPWKSSSRFPWDG